MNGANKPYYYGDIYHVAGVQRELRDQTFQKRYRERRFRRTDVEIPVDRAFKAVPIVSEKNLWRTS